MRTGEKMVQGFYIVCPKCKHKYNVHKMIYDRGQNVLMYCPNCMHPYPRKDGEIDLSNFLLIEK